MAKELTCMVCGTKYDACKSCDSRNLHSWKTITDTSNHYNIYMIVNDFYNKVIDKQEAKRLLDKCDINGYEKFDKSITQAITIINQTDSSNFAKKKRENKK